MNGALNQDPNLTSRAGIFLELVTVSANLGAVKNRVVAFR